MKRSESRKSMDETVRPPRKPVKRLRTDREREKIISLSTRNICCAVQSLSPLGRFVTPWTAARKASLSITTFWSLLKLISIKSVMLSNHLILCHPLLLLPSMSLTSKSFPESQLFTSGGQSTRTSASASVLPVNIQD